MEKELDHKNLREIAKKYYLQYHIQFDIIFIDKKLAIMVIIGCRTTSVHKFRNLCQTYARISFETARIFL